jgi:hypothetical protein
MKRAPKKLQLTRETLRALRPADLENVAGATITTVSWYRCADSNVKGCTGATFCADCQVSDRSCAIGCK